MKTVFTVGVFDVFHVGHVNLMKHAKMLGDRLVVAVQDDVAKYKPGVKIFYSLKERMAVIEAIRYVDKVIVYNDVDKVIQEVDFDIFVKGPDQIHTGFQKAVEYCKRNHKRVVEIPRTEGVSSTIIRKVYG